MYAHDHRSDDGCFIHAWYKWCNRHRYSKMVGFILNDGCFELMRESRWKSMGNTTDCDGTQSPLICVAFGMLCTICALDSGAKCECICCTCTISPRHSMRSTIGLNWIYRFLFSAYLFIRWPSVGGSQLNRLLNEKGIITHRFNDFVYEMN